MMQGQIRMQAFLLSSKPSASNYSLVLCSGAIFSSLINIFYVNVMLVSGKVFTCLSD
uniref:Uncharacterized protein n=1 Tax=Rhizophora mucronata TaxID=61149 RepID=A0A2P2PIW6_RHIMU